MQEKKIKVSSQTTFYLFIFSSLLNRCSGFIADYYKVSISLLIPNTQIKMICKTIKNLKVKNKGHISFIVLK